LFLGTAETADNPLGYFRTVDRHARIYQSTLSPGAKPQLLPRLLGPIRVREQLLPLPQTMTPTAALSEATKHRRALEHTAPPSILVDDANRVLHLSDNAGRYLLSSGGPLTADVAELMRRHRPWFRCNNCSGRAAVLYSAGEVFACRRCCGLN
jgi:two-component system CheB/CheR fusion protein